LKAKAEEERRARKDLLTGGGFDLNKVKARNDRIFEKQQDVFDKSSELTPKTS